MIKLIILKLNNQKLFYYNNNYTFYNINSEIRNVNNKIFYKKIKRIMKFKLSLKRKKIYKKYAKFLY